MSQVSTSCWPDVLDILHQEVGPERYNLWLCKTKLRSITPERAEIGAPNKLIAEQITGRFLDTISQAIAKTTGINPKIRIMVDGELFRAMREKQQKEIEDFSLSQIRKNDFEHSSLPFRFSRKFKLSNFVVGSCNRLAYEASKAVIEKPGKIYNPLFIYGKVGTGKTHLMQGIGQALLQHKPGHQVLYVSGEEFTNEFIEALQSRAGTTTRFRERFRNVDTLMIDDVHFLAGKKATQEEFLHTFNALLDVGEKQIIMASDAHPSDIRRLTKNLVQRFNSGLVTRVDPPDPDTCMQMIHFFIRNNGVEFSQEAMRYLVGIKEWNVRELEGALLTITAHSALNKAKITVLFVRKVLQHFRGDTPPTLGPVEILEGVSAITGIPKDEVLSVRRTKDVSECRQICMFLTRRLTQMSYQEIGDYFGGRNHATVIAAVKRIKQRMDADTHYRKKLENIEKNLVH